MHMCASALPACLPSRHLTSLAHSQPCSPAGLPCCRWQAARVRDSAASASQPCCTGAKLPGCQLLHPFCAGLGWGLAAGAGRVVCCWRGSALLTGGLAGTLRGGASPAGWLAGCGWLRSLRRQSPACRGPPRQGAAAACRCGAACPPPGWLHLLPAHHPAGPAAKWRALLLSKRSLAGRERAQSSDARGAASPKRGRRQGSSSRRRAATPLAWPASWGE